ncbi:MAG: hypothetical protein GVY13_17345 [Alphaproteobacteria bacterium]|nr:hypothetical protein [Alphaproteobacteria bacterium]
MQDVKAEVFEKVLKSLAAPERRAETLSLSAQRLLRKRPPFARTMALGIAAKEPDEYQLAVRIQQRMLERETVVENIRSIAKDEVDIQYIGRVLKQDCNWFREKNRPLVIGCSVGHFDITAGTLGCFVYIDGDPVPHILSNNHVLADENQAKIGDAIIQPGNLDQGKNPDDEVAHLKNYIKLSKSKTNHVDCAIARLADGIPFEGNQMGGLGQLRGQLTRDLMPGDKVRKIGRTSGITHGRVTAIELENIVIGFEMGKLRFDGVLEIEGEGRRPFSYGGDSGALIVDEELRAAGLLFAGGDQGGTNRAGLTYACPIGSVMDALGARIIC